MQIRFHYIRFWVTALALLSCYCLASVSCAEGSTNGSRPTASVVDAAIQQRLVKATEANDVKTIGELARAVQEQYWRQTLDICNALVSHPMDGTPLRLQLANQFGLDALEQADLMPIELEIAFLQCLLNDTGAAKPDDEWVTLRGKKAALYLHAWKRLDAMIDPNFDLSVPISINVMPPPGAGIPPGGDPSAITDPNIRKEYEALIEQNRKNIVKYNEQRRLRDLNKVYQRQAEQYLITAYSTPPYNIEELRTLLNQYITDRTIRERILNSVAQRMGLK